VARPASVDPRPERGLRRVLREPVNSLTHLAGALLSVAGTVVLVGLSRGEPWRVASFAVFGLSSVALFTASTLLHALWAGESAQRWLRRADHGAIFVLIAGSYTPLALVTLRVAAPAWGWALFAGVWGLSLLGLVAKLAWPLAPRWLSTALYLVLGWLAVVAIVPIKRALPAGGLAFLVAGGLFYSVGAVVYALKRPRLRPGVFGFHELWHVLVLAGWTSHFAMMRFYVLPG
jgi:hemolysin III